MEFMMWGVMGMIAAAGVYALVVIPFMLPGSLGAAAPHHIPPIPPAVRKPEDMPEQTK